MTGTTRQWYPKSMERQPTTPEPHDPTETVESLVNNSGSSFLAAMWFLPKEKRQAMYAVYSFCRAVDDVADGTDDLEEKRQQLRQWRDEIDRLFEGAPSTAIGKVLAPLVGKHGLRRDDFLAIVDGMEFDSADAVRIADGAALELYCDRVACAVGRLSNPIFGLNPEQGDPLADALGRALQVTNILRDLVEDAERDRLYVPLDLLAEHGISETGDAFAVLRHQAFNDVCRALAEHNAGDYRKAHALLAGCDRTAIRPARIMMEVYRRILERLIAREWRWPDLTRPVRVPRLEKIWIACRYGVF